MVGLLLGAVPVVALAENGGSAAAEEAALQRKLVRVQVEFIETSHEELTRLLAAPRTTVDDSDLRKVVGELVAKGDATVVETLLCTAENGTKLTTESVKEYIYPTEWDPAEVPAEVRTSPSGEKVLADARDSSVGPTPTAWETRNVGSNMFVEANVLGRVVSVSLTPEIVYHLGNDTWMEWKDTHGTTAVAMPGFYTIKFNTRAHLLAGKPLLVAALSPHGKDGMLDAKRKVLVFVRCDVLDTAPTPGQP